MQKKKSRTDGREDTDLFISRGLLYNFRKGNVVSSARIARECHVFCEPQLKESAYSDRPFVIDNAVSRNICAIQKSETRLGGGGSAGTLKNFRGNAQRTPESISSNRCAIKSTRAEIDWKILDCCLLRLQIVAPAARARLQHFY